MKKIEIAKKAILSIAAAFLFLHSLKIINIVSPDLVADLSGFSDGAMKYSAIFAIILFYIFIGLGVVLAIMFVVSLLTKRGLENELGLFNAAMDKISNLSDSLESNCMKILSAIALGGIADVALLFLGIFKCVTNTYSWGSSTSCPPTEQIIFLFAGMLCIVYAIFPGKLLFRKK